ncbi:MAG: beta strand repeat-containing protein [Desulfoprunum sp.]
MANLTGDETDNTINGTAEDDILEGLGGNDTLSGLDGSDYLDGGTGNDTLVGGDGDDTYVVDSQTDVISETGLVPGEYDRVLSTVTWTLGANLEELVLTGTAPIDGTGNALNNVIIGNTADNVLNGGAGDDYLDGGAGNDTLIGGAGNDWYYVDSTGDVITEDGEAADETDSVISTVDWTLGANLEQLYLTGTKNQVTGEWVEQAIDGIGNALNNTIVGNSADNSLYGYDGDDKLYGGVGNDTLTGGAGNDWYYVDSVGDVINEDSTTVTEIDTVVSTIRWTLGANLENLRLDGPAAINGTGNELDNILIGNAASNILGGGAGNDQLYGEAGNDILIGGTGNDTYVVDSSSDVVMEEGDSATEIDTVISSVSWTLGANLEQLALAGTSAINGTGNGLDNIILGNNANNILKGEAGNDILQGFAGIDTMEGGVGDDTYYVDNAGDVITETSTLPTEIDAVFASVSWKLGANFENLTLNGAAAIDGAGNPLDNTMTGNDAANVLKGGAGNDTLSGGAGNDTLNGGPGIDTMVGGTGNDTYFVENTGDVTTETSTSGTEIDKVFSSVTWTLGANIENLTLFGPAAINGTGNALNNSLVGNDAANFLNGRGGSDILSGGGGGDILYGGAGTDTMAGGLGNDIYYVDVAADLTWEAANAGIDTVFSTVSSTLSANMETLRLIGTAAINGNGNNLNNTVVGNTAANVLNGWGGNDILNGAGGNDFLAGGAGADTFAFDSPLSAAANNDSIGDFSHIDDTISLDRTIFAKLTTGVLDPAMFRASATGLAADSNDYVLYNTTTGALLYDTDGSSGGTAVQFATLTSKPQNITAADFVVIA